MTNLEVGAFGRNLDNSDKYHDKNIFRIPTFEEGYEKRAKILRRYLPGDITGLDMLDIGCGEGGFGRIFLSQGANVTFVDGREASLSHIKSLVPGVKTVLSNLEDDTPIAAPYTKLGMFLGVLYHLGSPLHAIKKVAAVAENIMLETACLDHDGTMLVHFSEDPTQTSFSVTGGACRPSPLWVEKALEQCGFTLIKDISSGELNTAPGQGHGGLLYDWPFQRTCGWRKDECSLRRIWIASKRKETSVFPDFQ